MLAIASITSGITSWDEETDYLGIRTQIVHALQLIRGASPDYKDIHSNLEYYGIAGLFPAWLIWFFQNSFLVGRLTLSQALFEPAAEHQLTGFYLTSHLVLAGEFIFLTLLVVKIAHHLGVRFPCLAGSIALLTPSLLGHSFVNPKDIPFALFYTVYTFTLVRRFTSKELRWLVWSVIAAGLLVNQKFVAIVPVLLTEMVFFAIQYPSTRSVLRLFLFPWGALLLALLLQPASWGLPPWVYLSDAFETFARHEWGGCMWWGNSCVGINQPGWLTYRYLWNWWSVKWPFLIVLLVGVQLIWCIYRLIKSSPTLKWRSPWLLLLAQLSFVPVLAVLRQSNLYDADRHTLFIYPALAVISAAGFERIWELNRFLIIRKILLVSTAILSLSVVVDDLVLHPYQSAYLNELGRLSHNHTTTSLDYWAISSKEALRQAQLNGALPLSPIVDDSVSPSPLWIGYRQIAGHVSAGARPKLIFQVRDVPAFRDLVGCDRASEVSRTLSTGHRLVMSRVWICK